jgi:hypothetical protein
MTARDEESQQILKKLEEINWIKNESVLDLTELISKNMDRQPELLAMLQPDLKHDLMHNPSVLKTIEKLERVDPINQRIKDVKDFISKIKSQTFGHFSEQ